MIVLFFLLAVLSPAVAVLLAYRQRDPACVICDAETLDACTCLRQYQRR